MEPLLNKMTQQNCNKFQFTQCKHRPSIPSNVLDDVPVEVFDDGADEPRDPVALAAEVVAPHVHEQPGGVRGQVEGGEGQRAEGKSGRERILGEDEAQLLGGL